MFYKSKNRKNFLNSKFSDKVRLTIWYNQITHLKAVKRGIRKTGFHALLFSSHTIRLGSLREPGRKPFGRNQIARQIKPSQILNFKNMILYQLMVEDQRNECEIALSIYKNEYRALAVANEMNIDYKRYGISMKAFVAERNYFEK